MKDNKEVKKIKFSIPHNIFIIGILIIIIVGGTISLFAHNQKMLNQDKEKLQILADEKSDQLEMYFEMQKDKQRALSLTKVFREVILDPENTTKIETANYAIDKIKDLFPGISVLNNEGIVIVGENDLPGMDYSFTPYFNSDKKEIVLEKYYDRVRKGDFIAVIGSVYDFDNPEKIIGSIAFDIKLEELSYIMSISFTDEKSEVYLIDQEGMLLSSSKYIGKNNKNGVLIQEIKSEGAIDCIEDLKKYSIFRNTNGSEHEEIEEEEEEVTIYENYMGDKVYGVHSYAPSIKGCIIAERKI